MSYLLDTNVLSEFRRPRPDANVLGWLEQADEDRIFISVITLAEIRRGINLMDSGRRRDALFAWLADEIPDRFSGRILGISITVATHWADLMAQGQRRGLAIATLDAFIGATALAHDLVIVTRNVKHFAPLQLPHLNPWEAT